MRRATIHGAAVRGAALACLLLPLPAEAQTATNLTALKGLATVSALPRTEAGRAALAANLRVTGDIQSGAGQQPYLMPFDEQRQLALRDCFITDGNATELADGLGSRLGTIYQERARYTDYKTFGNVTQSVADLIGYTNNITKSDSNSGKYFFANGTTDGKAPVSEAAAAILAARGGVVDVFGKAYERPAGAKGADAYGNSRPFQTLARLTAYRGADYFGQASHSLDWLHGPSQNLTDSPSYPSGHTTYGYTEALVLALLVPERYQQMIVRAAEYGNNRVVVGAHYAMDVLGGRTVALHAVAHLLANDPAYVGQIRKNPAVIGEMSRATNDAVAITDYRAALEAARSDLGRVLKEVCGDALATCAQADTGRFRDATANAAFYETTQTYGLPVVHAETAGTVEDVAKLAPEAGHLLTAAFPSLSLAEANAILTETQGPGGGFLDDGSAFGVYSRLNLYAAAGKAAELATRKQAGR
ncbi:MULTISPECIES: phosphatase PAP2 family protein [Methylobacterium]|jgi:membrane-associated phospholipid phosphatase|uniref:phosphatase PAP2 family protein n=1 Tax=Methylobacterium TaxID=407 RepID=UPI0008E71799|nr:MULTISPECIES: phosphatase PAP2 family protein [Methylobacterium]MBZ6415081.1 phosphatase PAP2 family protein [Methylobacterium sp.]MBK3397361.1 phosphatase PAP2 family protein [Methylobacterium ajmalii]MBK3412592.1 phosphatase PAP2 family protein [Methylobacterium ajmalii]MBK3421602.1 phosphatase PAP2 family protein [Methylobacterium ajmalii]SFF31878.1 PAP2 superfamily protein [Methylobacterium sp. yr596]